LQARRIAHLILSAAEEKQAEVPVILDLVKLTTIAHYFVIMHGNSDRHVKALAQHITDSLQEHKVKLFHVEGMKDGLWVLLDFGTVIAHVFYRETRDFYALERLWGEAREV